MKPTELTIQAYIMILIQDGFNYNYLLNYGVDMFKNSSKTERSRQRKRIKKILESIKNEYAYGTAPDGNRVFGKFDFGNEGVCYLWEEKQVDPDDKTNTINVLHEVLADSIQFKKLL